MASSYPGHEFLTHGRGFASLDPERQREVAGYVRPSPITTSPQSRPVSARAARSARVDRMRVQPDRDLSTYEGSSSRRSR